MRKTTILFILSLIFGLFIVPSAFATLTSVTINSPPSGMQTNDDTFLFNATVVWTNVNQTYNVTFMAGDTELCLNSTINGTRTSLTTGDFTCGASLTGLSDGTYTLRAEASNDTQANQPNALNSSGQNFIIDNVAPTCRIDILVTEIEPLGFFEIDCSRSSDSTGTINTSAYIFTITDAYSKAISKSSTSGIATFDGSDTETEGLYTAGCSVMDLSGNNRSCTNEEFQVASSDDGETTGEKVSKARAITRSNSTLYAILGIVVLLVLVVVVLVAINLSKKGKKR